MGKCARWSTWCHRRTFARRERSGGCSRVSTELVTRVKCLRRTWRKDSTNTAFREMRWCRVCTGGATLEALGVHWGDDFIFGIPDDRADDLEQLMREMFKVKICERIGPGFLTSVEFLHRRVAWNAEGFFWAHDPKTHTGND